MELMYALRVLITFGFAVILQYFMLIPKFDKKKTALILAGGYLVCSAAAMLVMYFFGVETMLNLYSVIIHAPNLIMFAYVSKNRGFSLFFNFITVLYLCFILDLIGKFIGDISGFGIYAEVAVRPFLIPITLLLVLKYIRKPYLKLLETQKKGWGLFCIIPFVSIVGLMPMQAQIAANGFDIEAACTAACYLLIGICSYMLVLVLFSNMSEKFALTEETTLLRSQKAAFIRQLDAITQAEQQLKIQRHDMRHYVRNISEMIVQGNADSALSYLGKIDSKLDDTKCVEYCTNPTVNAILAYYIKKARALDIDTELKFYMPENLDIDIVEFTAALSNALENAVNALEKLPKSSSRRLRIRTKDNPQFIIEIANTYAGNIELGENRLPKADKAGHGIGTQSIAAFAEKNNAILNYSIDEQWFKLRIVIDLK